MPHKLLLADDSVTIQKVIELTFADEDIEVVAVGDGRQAIETIPSERPDIVLADVGMPERDGYEVAAFVKGRPDLAHIPVLLLTGAFEPIDEGRARAAGCDGVLVKPFEPQMVINRVKDLIAGRRPPPGVAPALPAAFTPPSPAPVPPVPADEYFSRLDSVFPTSEHAPPTAVPAVPVPPVAAPAAGGAPASPSSPPVPAARVTPAPPSSPPVPAAGVTPAPPSPPPAPVAKAAAPGMATSLERVVDRPAGKAAGPSAAVPTLAEAFAALLAAEQGRVAPPPPVNEEALREEVVEQVTRRVIERMTDRVVREVALDVAERVVREEIERIRTQAR